MKSRTNGREDCGDLGEVGARGVMVKEVRFHSKG